MLEAANTSTALFGANPAKKLFGVLAGILEGEIALSNKSQAAALAAFQRAVSVEDSLVWDEPEPLPFSARHWLGAALLEMGRPAEAETGLPRRSQEAPAQRLVPPGALAGARGAEETGARGE